MLNNVAISPQKWRNAPQYENPSSSSELLALDFEQLAEIVAGEEQEKKFRGDHFDRSLQLAPIFLGNIPGALYKVSGSDPGETARVSADPETLVVMSGMLRISFPAFRVERQKLVRGDLTLTGGQVVDLSGQAVALSQIKPTEHFEAGRGNPCFAVALYRQAEVEVLD